MCLGFAGEGFGAGREGSGEDTGELQRVAAAGKQALWVSVAALLVRVAQGLRSTKGAGEVGWRSMKRIHYGSFPIPSRKRRPDPFRAGLVLGFLCAAVPAALGFLLCITFP